MFPSENVAISKLGFIVRPRSNLDLEGSVVAMEPKEVIDCGLGMTFKFPSSSNLDVLHEVERPEIVVNIDEPLIWAAEVGDFIVE